MFMKKREELEASKEICFEEISDNFSNENLKKLRILHFNDVYNIESRDIEPVGGCKVSFTVDFKLKNCAINLFIQLHVL